MQSFGCLLAISPDWIVVHASRNVVDYLGVEAEAVIGSPVKDLLGERAVHDLRTSVQLLSGPDAVERLFGLVTRIDGGKAFDVATHRSGANIIFELQPHAEAMKKVGKEIVMITTAIESADEPHAADILQTASMLGIRYYRMGWYKYDAQKSVADNLSFYANKMKPLAIPKSILGELSRVV